MKSKILTIFSVLLLSACSSGTSFLSNGSTTNSNSTIAKIRLCSFEEAKNKLQDGSVWTTGLQASADEISSTCIKKLALEAAGYDDTANSEAKSALSELMDTAANLKSTLGY